MILKLSVSRAAVGGFGAIGFGSVVYSFVLYKDIEPTRRDLERAAISRVVEGYSIKTTLSICIANKLIFIKPFDLKLISYCSTARSMSSVLSNTPNQSTRLFFKATLSKRSFHKIVVSVVNDH